MKLTFFMEIQMNENVSNLMNIIDGEAENLDNLALFEIANYLMESHGASRNDAIDAVEEKFGCDIVPGGTPR